MTDNENRISATARIGRDHRLGDYWHSLPDQQERQHGLHHLRIAFGQDGVPQQPFGQYDLHVLSVSCDHQLCGHLSGRAHSLSIVRSAAAEWRPWRGAHLRRGLVGRYIFLWITRRYPLFGWFLFGFASEFLGGGRLPPVTADNRQGFRPSLTGDTGK